MMDDAGTFTTDEQVSRMLDTYMSNHYKRLPINFTMANGASLYAGERKVLDMMAQYSAAGFGRGSKDASSFFMQVVAVIHDEFVNGCGVLPGSCANEVVARAAKALCEFTGMERVLFKNTGTEAFDAAVKIIRKWAYVNRGITDGEIIVCTNNFHGRSIAAISASDTEQYKVGFGPLLPGFSWAGFGSITCLNSAISLLTLRLKKFIGFIVEPVEGEGGINVPPLGYLTDAKRICHEHGALFCLDEVQTGFGRTGYPFAWQLEGPEAKPDLMMVGKMLSAGTMPISAVVGSDEVMRVLQPGDEGSTFAGTPLVCRVVSKVVEIFKNHEIFECANQVSLYLKHNLVEIMERVQNPFFEEVRGRGLLLGIKFKTQLAEYFQARLLEEGVLAGVAGHGQVLRFSPPLIITRNEIDWAAPRIERALTMDNGKTR